MKKNEILRAIPKIDEVLKQHILSDCFEESGRETVTATAREVIDGKRASILELNDDMAEIFDAKSLLPESVAEEVLRALEVKAGNRLYGVINATGTILHTNLGRAPLCKEAVENVSAVSRGYSNLEYDVEAGKRGSRHDIVRDLIVELTGAEEAMVVNNNASATMIVLSSIAEGKEVIVSRGELVEIGGAFRIPDIMEQSGATLRDIGTTNKTKISDYSGAIYRQGDESSSCHRRGSAERSETGALMKVHTSNYKIMGFTEDVSLEALVELGEKEDLPVIFDMGNGLMVDLSEYGLDEPNVPASLSTGIDIMLFSGDKLMGGPQAGIIVGKKKYIEKMKKHPLARALRVDKMTFAALEETLKKYRDTEIAKRDIPVLRMITESKNQMLARAEKLAEMVSSAANKDCDYTVRVAEVEDQIGGGSAPNVFLPGYAVSVKSSVMSTKAVERMLRQAEVPVVARIHDDELLLCVRTIGDDEFAAVASAFE